MRSVLLWVIIGAVLVGGIVLYRSRESRQSHVEPHAAEEIEKAKRR